MSLLASEIRWRFLLPWLSLLMLLVVDLLIVKLGLQFSP